jgi:hypothetical protein
MVALMSVGLNRLAQPVAVGGSMSDPPLEMDTLPVQPQSTGKSRKSPELHKLARSDYAIGICLLLLVVFLWTTSNFVTQVQPIKPSLTRTITTRMLVIRTCSSGDTRNLSCPYYLFLPFATC